MASSQPIIVREVWCNNLVEEFKHIRHYLPQFPLVSFDTEFPGTIYHTHLPKHIFFSLSPEQFYAIVKQNVDDLNLIQLGLTLSDADGNLPRLGTDFQYIWQFNFSDFDSDRDLHNPDSIALLQRQGIDFEKNKRDGINSHSFAREFLSCGLGRAGSMNWITFQGEYDYGYLIKVLTRQRLPDNFEQYLQLVRHYFGLCVYDLKPITRAIGLHGGLEKIASIMDVGRATGKSHQAGSDSLLTMQVFLKVMKCCPPPPAFAVVPVYRRPMSYGLRRGYYVQTLVPVVNPGIIVLPSLNC